MAAQPGQKMTMSLAVRSKRAREPWIKAPKTPSKLSSASIRAPTPLVPHSHRLKSPRTTAAADRAAALTVADRAVQAAAAAHRAAAAVHRAAAAVHRAAAAAHRAAAAAVLVAALGIPAIIVLWVIPAKLRPMVVGKDSAVAIAARAVSRRDLAAGAHPLRPT